MDFSTDAIELIKEFEGLSLRSYTCPAGYLTVGYGHVGPDVVPYLEISESRAEELLVDDMQWASDTVNGLVDADLTQSQFDALVSFVFNIGAGAFGDSTLLRRINSGEPVGPAIEQELPRWNKGGGEVLPGLVRRRQAEVELAQKDKEPAPVASDSSISLVNAATYFKGLPHQAMAFEYLEDLLTLEELDEFARLFRDGGASGDRVLPVRHMIQLDNGPEGNRQCFTTTCAMLLEFMRPGTLSSENGDLDYLERVEQYGDTTDSSAQIKALRSYGLNARFVQNASMQTLEEQIRKGVPVPTGWLHYGTPNNCSGGGHWSLVIGIEGDKIVHNDPFGECSLISGGYPITWITAGQAVRYSRKNWGPRWEVEGPGTGWAVLID